MRQASAGLMLLVVLLGSGAAGLANGDTAHRVVESVPAWQLDDAPRAGHVDAIGGNHDVLVIVLGDGRTMRSLDGGTTWTPIETLPALGKAWVEFDPSDAARGYIAAVGGVWRTTDHGATWTQVLDIARAPRIDVSPSGAISIGARFADATNTIMVSTDHGATWSDLDAPIPTGEPICGVAFGLDDDQILTMTDAQSWYSHDAGTTWVETAGSGFNFANEDRAAVWRIDMGALHKTTDGGATWTAVTAPGVGTLGAAHPDGGFYFASNIGLLLTRDGGDTWDNLGHGDQVFDATGVLADPHDPAAVYVTDKLVGLARVQRAPDGVSWYDGRPLDLPPAPINAVATIGDGRTVAAGDAGLFLRGDTWRHTGAGLGAVTTISAVAASTDGTHIYAAGLDITDNPAALASTDGGRTFSAAPVQDITGTVTEIAVDPTDATHALLVLATTGVATYVLETHDGGATWTDALPAPLPTPVTGLAWHGASGMPVVGTEAGAIARLGDAWLPLGTEPLTRLGGNGDAVAATGLTQHWHDLDLAAPVMGPVARDAPLDAVDLAVTSDAVWLLGDVLSKCRTGDDHCSTMTLPEGARAIAPHDDGRVYLAAADGLYRVMFL